jgi:hypothetical protein
MAWTVQVFKFFSFSFGEPVRLRFEFRALLFKFCCCCCYLFFWYWGLNSGPTPWATPPALFCDGLFQDKVSWTVAWSWHQTMILLISASWVARIIRVSHQCQLFKFLIAKFKRPKKLELIWSSNKSFSRLALKDQKLTSKNQTGP